MLMDVVEDDHQLAPQTASRFTEGTGHGSGRLLYHVDDFRDILLQVKRRDELVHAFAVLLLLLGQGGVEGGDQVREDELDINLGLVCLAAVFAEKRVEALREAFLVARGESVLDPVEELIVVRFLGHLVGDGLLGRAGKDMLRGIPEALLHELLKGGERLAQRSVRRQRAAHGDAAQNAAALAHAGAQRPAEGVRVVDFLAQEDKGLGRKVQRDEFAVKLLLQGLTELCVALLQVCARHVEQNHAPEAAELGAQLLAERFGVQAAVYGQLQSGLQHGGLIQPVDGPLFRDLLDCRVQRIFQFLGNHGLENVILHTEVNGRLGIFKFRVVAENDNVRFRIQNAGFPQKFNSSHDGHLDIGQDDVGGPVLQNLQSIRAVFRFTNLKGQVRVLNQIAQALPFVYLVIHHKQVKHGSSSFQDEHSRICLYYNGNVKKK